MPPVLHPLLISQYIHTIFIFQSLILAANLSFGGHIDKFLLLTNDSEPFLLLLCHWRDTQKPEFR